MISLSWGILQPYVHNYTLPAVLLCLTIFGLYRVSANANVLLTRLTTHSGRFRLIYPTSRASLRSRATYQSLATFSNLARTTLLSVRNGSRNTATRCFRSNWAHDMELLLESHQVRRDGSCMRSEACCRKMSLTKDHDRFGT